MAAETHVDIRLTYGGVEAAVAAIQVFKLATYYTLNCFVCRNTELLLRYCACGAHISSPINVLHHLRDKCVNKIHDELHNGKAAASC